MKKSIKVMMLTLLIVALMNAAVFTPAASATETEKLPKAWVKIHRIQAVGSTENDFESGTYWGYAITVSDSEKSIPKDYTYRESSSNDVTVDRDDSFINIKSQTVSVKISVYKGDVTADISNSLGTSFDCIYNLATNEIVSTNTAIEEDYYKTSGESNKNGANLWFTIFDNYNAPVANAGKDQSVYTGEIKFDGSSSTASEGSSIVKFEWDFEDDGIIDAEGVTAKYTFIEEGMRTCRLIVTDSLGVTVEDTCRVNVLNRKPIAEFTFAPSIPTIQDNVTMTDNSSDPDGTVTSWFWDFGDGTNSTTQNPVHIFSQKGDWQVTLTITDNHGATASTTNTVTVVNLPPAAEFNCTTSNQTDMEIQFTDTSIDPENKSISWLWDFGDGNTSELQTPTHAFKEEGEYNVTLTVTDDENATDTYTMTIPVTKSQTSDAFPLWIIAVIVIVVAASGFVGLFWWNRRRKGFSEMFVGSDDPMQ